MKKIKLKAVWRGLTCALGPGLAKVIGQQPKDDPYINLENTEGVLLVSIDRREMDRIVKAWAKARGGYPV